MADTKNPPSGGGSGTQAPFGQGNPGGQVDRAPGELGPGPSDDQCHGPIPEGGKWPLLGTPNPGGQGNTSRMK